KPVGSEHVPDSSLSPTAVGKSAAVQPPDRMDEHRNPFNERIQRSSIHAEVDSELSRTEPCWRRPSVESSGCAAGHGFSGPACSSMSLYRQLQHPNTRNRSASCTFPMHTNEAKPADANPSNG